MFYSIFLVGFILWTIFFGLDLATAKLFEQQSLDNVNQEIKIETQLAKRQQILLDNSEKKYKELTDCITTDKEASK